MSKLNTRTGRLAAFAGTALLAMSLVACQSAAPAPAPSPTDSGAPATEAPAEGGIIETPATLQVGIIPSPDSAVLYLGVDEGFFSQYGIELEFNAAQGGAAIVPPVVSGQWQLGFSNIVSIMQAVENGQPLVIIAPSGSTWGEEGKGINRLYVRGDSGITSAAQLEGKTVAVNTLGNLLQTEAEVSISSAGGDPSKVNFVEVPPPSGVAALIEGQVDAAMCNEPFCMQMEAQGAVELDDSAYTLAPGETVATAAWFTTRQQIEDNPQLFANLQAAINESNAFATANPDKTREKMLEVVTTLDPEAAKVMLLNNWPASFEEASLAPLAEAAVRFGHLKAIPDYDSLVWVAE